MPQVRIHSIFSQALSVNGRVYMAWMPAEDVASDAETLRVGEGLALLFGGACIGELRREANAFVASLNGEAMGTYGRALEAVEALTKTS